MCERGETSRVGSRNGDDVVRNPTAEPPHWSGFHPDWVGWRWVRKAVLLFFLTLSGFGVLTSLSLTGSGSGELTWLGVLAALYLLIVWIRTPTWVSLSFTAVFIAMEFSMPDKYYGAAWFLTYAVCVDSNSRRPLWAGLGIFGGVLLTELVLGDEQADRIAAMGYLIALLLLGQFIRAVFAGSRAELVNASLRHDLERASLTQAVHDSGGTGLTHILMVAREMKREVTSPQDFRDGLDLLIEIATTGATELRRAINPERSQRSSISELEKEWFNSIKILHAAGFDVADSPPVIFPELDAQLEDDTIRLIREATANICFHASHKSRVVVLANADAQRLSFSWLNDIGSTHSFGDGGMGLSGIRNRTQALKGHMDADANDGIFSLRISVPVTHGPPDTNRATSKL